MTLEEELDAATLKVDSLANTVASWSGPSKLGNVELNVTVWTKPEGDVPNRLADLLRAAADAMEVSRV